jgi:CRISPR system Cascade subunit CasE
MHFSRLILNLSSREVRRDLADCQELHRTILKAFPDSPADTGDARKEFGLLFRVENDQHTGLVRVYVQSQIKPGWSILPPGYLLETPGGPENPACKSIDEQYGRLSNGMVLAFVLRANPTRKVGTTQKTERLAGAKNNGRRVLITGFEEQLEWLRRKGQTGGFELMSVRVDEAVPDADALPEGRISGHRRKVGGQEGKPVWSELTFGSVLFRGHLRVSDHDKFLKTLVEGVGSGKAYGFGLLSLAPPR